jgi:hypothetical protein
VIVDKSLLPLWEQVKDKTEIEHVFRRRGLVRGAARRLRPDDYEDPRLDEDTAAAMCYRAARPGCPGRPLLAPLDRPAYARTGARGSARAARHRRRDAPPGRADVPRECLGLPVPVPDGRSQARLPWAVPRPRVAARRLRAARRDDHRRRAHDLDGILGMLDKEPERWDLSSCTRCSSAGCRRRRAR